MIEQPVPTAELYSLLEIAEQFSDIEAALKGHVEPNAVLKTLATLAVARVPGAEYAGVTVGAKDEFKTRAATDELVWRTDAIQYELQAGPCVDAALEETTYNAADLAHDQRWPEFGRRAALETGIRSMYAVRLYIDDDPDAVAALNLYATQPEAFGDDSAAIALLLATHGSLALGGATSREMVANLRTAVASNREIGIAIGILMNQHHVTRDQGFDLLRLASQHTHRKLADIAGELVHTGSLPTLPLRRSRS